MIHLLEITIQMTDGKEYHDFMEYVGVDTREQAICIETNSLLVRIKKAKQGNPIWANNSARYTEWLSFQII